MVNELYVQIRSWSTNGLGQLGGPTGSERMGLGPTQGVVNMAKGDGALLFGGTIVAIPVRRITKARSDQAQGVKNGLRANLMSCGRT